MSVSDLRFGSVQALRSATKNVPFTRYTRGRDKAGYYITEYELDPVLNELFNEMKAAAASVANRNEPEPEQVAADEPGPVQQVREWVIAHPKATREQVMEALPHLNPATVRIQYARYHKSRLRR